MCSFSFPTIFLQMAPVLGVARAPTSNCFAIFPGAHVGETAGCYALRFPFPTQEIKLSPPFELFKKKHDVDVKINPPK